jgi:hypothetical protein
VPYYLHFFSREISSPYIVVEWLAFLLDIRNASCFNQSAMTGSPNEVRRCLVSPCRQMLWKAERLASSNDPSTVFFHSTPEYVKPLMLPQTTPFYLPLQIEGQKYRFAGFNINLCET